MSFRFDDAVIETRRGPRDALVMTPTTNYLVGRERLSQLRASGMRSNIDLSLVDRVRNSDKTYRVVVFRGRGEAEEERWRLDEGLDPEELDELSRRLAQSHLPTWRMLLRSGVWLMVHTDMGSTASPMRSGSREVAEDPQRDPTVPPEVATIDEWLLKHLVFYFSQSYDNAMETLLPNQLPSVEARQARLEGFAEVLGKALD